MRWKPKSELDPAVIENELKQLEHLDVPVLYLEAVLVYVPERCDSLQKRLRRLSGAGVLTEKALRGWLELHLPPNVRSILEVHLKSVSSRPELGRRPSGGICCPVVIDYRSALLPGETLSGIKWLEVVSSGPDASSISGFPEQGWPGRLEELARIVQVTLGRPPSEGRPHWRLLDSLGQSTFDPRGLAPVSTSLELGAALAYAHWLLGVSSIKVIAATGQVADAQGTIASIDEPIAKMNAIAREGACVGVFLGTSQDVDEGATARAAGIALLAVASLRQALDWLEPYHLPTSKGDGPPGSPVQHVEPDRNPIPGLLHSLFGVRTARPVQRSPGPLGESVMDRLGLLRRGAMRLAQKRSVVVAVCLISAAAIASVARFYRNDVAGVWMELVWPPWPLTSRTRFHVSSPLSGPVGMSSRLFDGSAAEGASERLDVHPASPLDRFHVGMRDGWTNLESSIVLVDGKLEIDPSTAALGALYVCVFENTNRYSFCGGIRVGQRPTRCVLSRPRFACGDSSPGSRFVQVNMNVEVLFEDWRYSSLLHRYPVTWSSANVRLPLRLFWKRGDQTHSALDGLASSGDVSLILPDSLRRETALELCAASDDDRFVFCRRVNVSHSGRRVEHEGRPVP